MGFGTWLPLILLILVPIIILLYMLKQKAKEFEFSSNLLWKEIYQNIEATKPWEKLKNNLLMMLQIIAVLLMILILMSPYIKARGTSEKNIILVIDCSASMNTMYDEKNTRLDVAKDKACAYIDSLGIGANVTIISSTNTGNLIVTNGDDKLELKQAIQKLEQTVLPGDITNSLTLVQSALAQWENGEVLVFTDTVFDAGKMEVGVVSLYTPNTNISMDYISCSRTENGYTVLLRMTNHSDETLSREINLYNESLDDSDSNDSNGEQLLDIRQVSFLPKETQVVYFESLSIENPVIRAEFQEEDALKEDDIIFCTIEEVVKNRILLVTKSNLFLEKALLNLAGIEVFRTDDVAQIPKDEDSFDLYILDGVSCNESDLPVVGNLLLVNSNVAGITDTGSVLQNRVLTFVESELTGYITEDTFGVNEAIPYTLPRWGVPFLSCGEDVIGFFGEYDGRHVAVMGFDLHNTDLGLQPQFPILMANLMEYLLEHGLVSQTNFLAGDSILLNGSSKGNLLQIKSPDGTVSEMEVSLISNAYTNTTKLGAYFISQEVEGEVTSQCVAVNFPVTNESDVTSVNTSFGNADSNQEEIIIEGAIDLKNYILLLLVGLLFVEWYIYIKKM